MLALRTVTYCTENEETPLCAVQRTIHVPDVPVTVENGRLRLNFGQRRRFVTDQQLRRLPSSVIHKIVDNPSLDGRCTADPWGKLQKQRIGIVPREGGPGLISLR